MKRDYKEFGARVHAYVLEGGMNIMDACRKAEEDIQTLPVDIEKQIAAQKLFNKLNNCGDTYTQIASELFEVPYYEVTKEQRQEVKRYAFAYVYGNPMRGNWCEDFFKSNWTK
jgi:hypothetical protein